MQTILAGSEKNAHCVVFIVCNTINNLRKKFKPLVVAPYLSCNRLQILPALVTFGRVAYIY